MLLMITLIANHFFSLIRMKFQLNRVQLMIVFAHLEHACCASSKCLTQSMCSRQVQDEGLSPLGTCWKVLKDSARWRDQLRAETAFKRRHPWLLVADQVSKAGEASPRYTETARTEASKTCLCMHMSPWGKVVPSRTKLLSPYYFWEYCWCLLSEWSRQHLSWQWSWTRESALSHRVATVSFHYRTLNPLSFTKLWSSTCPRISFCVFLTSSSKVQQVPPSHAGGHAVSSAVGSPTRECFSNFRTQQHSRSSS